MQRSFRFESSDFTSASSNRNWQHHVTLELLDKALTHDMMSGVVNGAQWFRQADLWFRANHGYNNPLNFGSVNSELDMLHLNSTKIGDLLGSRSLVIMGVGVGDTESAIVDYQLERNKRSKVTGIDINPVFLRLFESSLRHRASDLNTIIDYIPINNFFESLVTNDVRSSDRQDPRIALVCLGSTIGNFAAVEDIFSIFKELTIPEDLLLITYQLDTHLESIFRRYSTNDLYLDLISNYLDPSVRQQVVWNLDRSCGLVEAYYDQKQIFRSRKFAMADLDQTAQDYGFYQKFIFIDSYRNLCLQAFLRS